MANQERSAHVSNTEHNAHWRGARPLFWSWRLRVNGLERTGNHPAFTAAGCDLRRSQGRIGAPGMVWPCGTSAAPIARLARIARSIPSRAGPKDPAIRIEQRDVSIPVLRANAELLCRLAPALTLALARGPSMSRSMSKSKKGGPLLQESGITDPGHSIGIRAPIRVQWWLVHAHQ